MGSESGLLLEVNLTKMQGLLSFNMDVSKNRGKNPKMDGETNGKPNLKWMIWGYHYFWKHPYRGIIVKDLLHVDDVISHII